MDNIYSTITKMCWTCKKFESLSYSQYTCLTIVILNILKLESFIVFIHLGCFSKTPQTGWLIKNGDLFLMVLKARSPKQRCGQIQCLVRVCFINGHLCAEMAEGTEHVAKGYREIHGISFMRTLISSMKASSSGPQ